MNEVATFFRHRENDPGMTYQLRMEGPNGPFDYFVYSRRPLERRAVQDQQPADREAHQQAVKDLRNAVRQAGGGLIVWALDRKGGRTVGVMPVESAGFQPPEEFVVLSPGQTSHFVVPKDARRGEEGRKYDLAGGSHVMVPVDDEAKEHLGKFIQELEWLTRDVESLVLQAIRRPNLDGRLSKIESHLFGRPNDGGEAKKAGWRGWKAAVAVSILAVAILLAFVLARDVFVTHYLGLSSPRVLQTMPAKTDAAKPVSVIPVTPAASSASESPNEEVYVAAARELLQALQASTDPAVVRLKPKHFNSLPRDVTALFRKDHKPFLWGLIKLEAVDLYRRKFKTDPADLSFLDEPDNISKTKQVFRDIWNNQFKAGETEQRFLLALACRLGDVNAPQLPTQGKACKDFTADDIANGLPGLADFVEGKK